MRASTTANLQDYILPTVLQAVPAPYRPAAAFGVPRGGALPYSLIESAKLAGVEPRGYLRWDTLRAVRNPGTVTSRATSSPR